MLAGKTELEQLMRCPVNWDRETGIENWEWSLLHLDWLHCLGEQFPEASDVPVTPEDYEGIFEDSYEHDHLLKNLRVYRPKRRRNNNNSQIVVSIAEYISQAELGSQ